VANGSKPACREARNCPVSAAHCKRQVSDGQVVWEPCSACIQGHGVDLEKFVLRTCLFPGEAERFEAAARAGWGHIYGVLCRLCAGKAPTASQRTAGLQSLDVNHTDAARMCLIVLLLGLVVVPA